jgi:uncharacterized protein YdeI (YjbR/CyaY-like superfamily)
MIRFTENAKVAAMEDIIGSYLREAMQYADAGIMPPKDTSELELPCELAETLDADPELAEAFYKLTRGRQRSYGLTRHECRAETAYGRKRVVNDPATDQSSKH